MPDATTLLLLLAIGAAAGLSAGLLGIGGGVIVVPALLFLFARDGVDSAVAVQAAIGTSLATIMFTAVSSVRAHHARGAIHWPVFRKIVPGVLLGGLIGAAIAAALPGKVLKILFGIFLLIVALELARSSAIVPHRPLPGRPAMATAGLGIGIMAALFGVGGGTMTVPFLVWCSVPVVEAVATSAAVGLPIAIAGTIGYVVAGWQVSGLPPGSLGYVVLAPFAGIAITSVLFAPLGARIAHRLPQAALRRVFAVFLVVVALRLLLS